MTSMCINSKNTYLSLNEKIPTCVKIFLKTVQVWICSVPNYLLNDLVVGILLCVFLEVGRYSLG